MSCVWVTLCCNSANADLWEWLNPELGRLRGEVERIRSVLQERRDGYGAMTIGVTASELGAQIHMTTEPPTVPFWLQLEFAESRDFDCVAVIPAVSGINTGDGATYAFPKAFRVDASDDKYFTTFQPIANFSNTDLEAKRSLPFVMRIPKTKAKYIRITILELAEVANRWTYALGEVIVLDGNRNIAMESNVEIGLTPRIPFKWHPRYLLDGRTPLGEMIELDLPEFDGVYCAPEKEGDPNWMMLDLREIFGIQEIRLQPIHARQGASLPGFGFPKRLRVDVFKDESLTDGYCVFNSGDELFSNPGVNLVTFVADNVKGRFVKVTCLETSDSDPKRFGLSEIQVYSGGQNVALQATASIPGKQDKDRMPHLLVDGYSSFGRLIELPQWLDGWAKFRRLNLDLEETVGKTEVALELAQKRVNALAAGTTALSLFAGFIWTYSRRRKRRLEKQRFRIQLAQDLHDEIGSNLAAIARLSEVATLESDADQMSLDWNSVRQMALECTDSMRATLWLLGGPRHYAGDLTQRMKQAAIRMLPDVEIDWRQGDPMPKFDENKEIGRELFLAFKEIIANVAKHADATKLKVDLTYVNNVFSVSVEDNGVGFSHQQSDGDALTGMGLSNIRHRARKFGGNFSIESPASGGTQVQIQLPVKS